MIEKELRQREKPRRVTPRFLKGEVLTALFAKNRAEPLHVFSRETEREAVLSVFTVQMLHAPILAYPAPSEQGGRCDNGAANMGTRPLFHSPAHRLSR